MHKLPKFHLVLLIHSHQPVGNFDHVFEQTYQRSYLPFVASLMRHPGVRMGLHYTGPLLEWCEEHHPEFLDLLRQLVMRGQVEMIGGGFYEPILASLPQQDQAEQLRRLREYLERKFGSAPAGAWLAERVWEPQLPSTLSSAGVRYTLLDDVHFLAAGFELNQLHGDYVAEDGGQTVRVLPGLKALRYLLPFRPPEDAIAFLQECAARNSGGMAAMGDDCEKFGAWPGTYDHCYRDGWVDRFFAAIEAATDWLMATPPGEFISTHAPLGRADLPTASYSEMMEWVLPTPARNTFQDVSHAFGERPDVMRFLRGGQWRGFFSKYSESNLLHKKMLHVSRELQELAVPPLSQEQRETLDRAKTHLLRAQCNDAYWHGVFGGLYAPHLRTEPWRELVRAETMLHEIASPDADRICIERADYDADGAEELYVTSARIAALVRPADGGTIASLDFRTRGVTLINSLQRRPEAYHGRLREASGAKGGSGEVASIHNQVRSKEPGLERFLQYDRWPRNAFRVLLFAPGKTFEQYRLLKLDEDATIAGGSYTTQTSEPQSMTLVREASVGGFPSATRSKAPVLRCTKVFSFAHEQAKAQLQVRDGYQVGCRTELTVAGVDPWRAMVGIEIVLDLLAPEAPDRYFETDAGKQPLRWSGAIQPSALRNGRLRIVDEWQDVAVTIEAPRADHFWIAPIETVSESEEGFERVYQGSQILAVWLVELSSSAAWRGEVNLHISCAHRA